MVENQYKYTAGFKQAQTVGDIRLEPMGGWLSEREYKIVRQNAYGASLLEAGLLIVKDVAALAPSGGAISDIQGRRRRGRGEVSHGE
jgi:hypothetical protein